MYRKYVYSGTTWFDIISADTIELLEITNIYNLEKDLVKKIANDSGKTGVFPFANCVYISLSVPCIENIAYSQSIIDKRISFVLGNDFVITSRFSDIRGFKQAKKILKKDKVVPDTFSLFFLQTLLSSLYSQIKFDITHQLPIVKSLVDSDSLLQEYQKTLSEHEEVFRVFSAIALEFFKDPHGNNSLQQIMNEYEDLQKIIKQQNMVHIDCLDNRVSPFQIVHRLFKRRR